VRVVFHVTDRFVDVVGEGFDIAVRVHAAPLADSDLVRRRLGTDPFWLVASPRYLRKRGVPKRPEELGSHDALLARPSATTLTLRDEQGRTVVVEPEPRFFADEAHVLLAAARGDLGFTVVPESLCREDIDSGTLRRVLPAWTAGEVTTTLLVPERRAEIPAVRVLVDALASRFSEVGPTRRGQRARS
jgi:DNA-binding transcriptional LysR family regulator